MCLNAAFQTLASSKKNCKYFTRYRCCPFETECLYLHDKHARWLSPVCGSQMWKYRWMLNWLFTEVSCLARQYHTEDDDYVVDPLNLLLALTLLGRDLDEDNEDYLDFPFYLSVEYDLWFFFICPRKLANGLRLPPEEQMACWNVTQIVLDMVSEY